MASPSADIANYLGSKSLTWRIYIGREPYANSPGVSHQAIIIKSLAGQNPHPSLARDYPHIEIMVRGFPGEYNETYTKAVEVRDVLLGAAEFDVGSNAYRGVWQSSEITFLRYDGDQRPVFTVRFRMIRNRIGGSGNRREVDPVITAGDAVFSYGGQDRITNYSGDQINRYN